MTRIFHSGPTQGLAAVASVEAPATTNLSLRARPAIHAALTRAPRTSWLACLLLALFSNPAAQAQAQAQAAPSSPLSQPAAVCPASPVYPLPVGAPALQILLTQINALAPLCRQHAPFYAWRGAVRLALRQPAAAEALERALLLDPTRPGAQLD